MNIDATLVGSAMLHKVVRKCSREITNKGVNEATKGYSSNCTIKFVNQIADCKKLCSLPKPDFSNNSFTEPVNSPLNE